MVSILHDMHRHSSFGPLDEYYELLGNLKKAIGQGLVKEIPPSSDKRRSARERWFVEDQTGVVFRLEEPDAPFRGSWTQVDFSTPSWARTRRPEKVCCPSAEVTTASSPTGQADPEHERLVAKSIFVEMHRGQQFGSWQEYYELRGRLVDAIEQGLVKEIAPSSDSRPYVGEKWFVENSSGIVFRVLRPDPPVRGWWAEVEFPKTAAS